MITAKRGASLDPARLSKAVRDTGFEPKRMRIRALGVLVFHQDFLALELPGGTELIVLAGGALFEQLRASDTPAGSRLEVEGDLHPSHADQPPGMEVAAWKVIEPAGELP